MSLSNSKMATDISHSERWHMIAVASFDFADMMDQFMDGLGKHELPGVDVKVEVKISHKNIGIVSMANKQVMGAYWAMLTVRARC